jgi:uncharacterized protein (DUF952 family)
MSLVGSERSHLLVRMIYHILPGAEWEQAQAAGVYRPGSLQEEGFIHAAYKEQVLDVANILFAGETGLVLLCIEPSRVTTPIRHDLVEFPEGTESLHPHFYGPLNLGAVVRVMPFPPQSDGTFSLPANL